MILILLGIVLAVLPLILTSSFPHLMVVSIYAGLAHLFAFAWAIFVLTILLRRDRIKKWRETRKLKKKPKAKKTSTT